MNIVDGDLIKMAKEGRFDVIVHGCNCFCTMGAGIAKQIARAFPAARLADIKTMAGDSDKMGTYTSAVINDKLTVVNAYTQFNYGGTGVNVDYSALTNALNLVALDFDGLRIGLPKIGCGLAGGDWGTVKSIIEEALRDQDYTVVNYNGGK